MLDHEHEHHHNHDDHETRELNDDELALVSGGGITPPMCPCGQQHPGSRTQSL